MEIILVIFCFLATILLIIGMAYQHSFNKKYSKNNSIRYENNIFLSKELGKEIKDEKYISLNDVKIEK